MALVLCIVYLQAAGEAAAEPAAADSSGAIDPADTTWMLVATALVLVPSPLVEPRYFVVPFFFLHVNATGAKPAWSAPVLALELAWCGELSAVAGAAVSGAVGTAVSARAPSHRCGHVPKA